MMKTFGTFLQRSVSMLWFSPLKVELIKYPSLHSCVENFVQNDKDHPWGPTLIESGSTDAAYRVRVPGWLMFCLILVFYFVITFMPGPEGSQ